MHPDGTSELITFDYIISVLESNSDAISSRFMQSLEKWKVNPNQVLQ